MSTGWRLLAACRNAPEGLFHGPDGESENPKTIREQKAKQEYCATCPVAGDCLAFAVTTGERHGVWGGTTEDERYLLRINAGLVTPPWKCGHPLEPGNMRWNGKNPHCRACERNHARKTYHAKQETAA